MQPYTTIVGVIEFRLAGQSYDVVQKRYSIGSSTVTLIMKRFKDLGLSLNDLKQMEPKKLENAFYPPENLRRKDIPMPDYEKLYERAEELDVDVLKCGFYCCANGKTTDSTSIYAVAEDGEVFDIRQKPKLLMSAGNWWNGVYKRRFLQENHIRNIYSPGASYQDFSWMASTLSQAKRISILHRALYYYNVENPDASIKASGEKAFYIMHHCLEANRILREKGLFAHVREEIGVHEFKTCLSRDGYLRKDLRPAFFERFREVVTDLCREGGMRFRYLLPNEKLLLFALKHGHRRLFFAILDSGAYRGIVRLKRWMKQTSVAQLYFRLRMR